MKLDLGTIWTLSGALILTSYVAAPTASILNAGRADTLRFNFKVTTIAGSNITSLTVKFSVSHDGVTYEDVFCQKTDATYVAEPATTIAAAGTPQEATFTLPGSYAFVKVQMKVGGGVGQTGESIAVSAQAA